MKEDYGKKAYMDENKIEDVRFRFKSRVGLLPFAGNFSKDKRFAKSNWLCRCGEKENESHIKDGTCPIYSDIRIKYGDLDNDEDLVTFFSEVLDRRSKLELLEMEMNEASPPLHCDPFTINEVLCCQKSKKFWEEIPCQKVRKSSPHSK